MRREFDGSIMSSLQRVQTDRKMINGHFYNPLNIVGVNSYVLLNMATNQTQKRRHILKKIAIHLITPQMEEIFTWPTFPTNLQVLLGGILKNKRPLVEQNHIMPTKKR